MNKIFFFLFINLFTVTICAQQELHIHHINIENGDATLISIYDVAQDKYTSKILIDGGQISAEKMLLPYIRKMVGNNEESVHFNYVILTHYHNDHYTGLMALNSGRITADSIIDPGGYRVSAIFNHTAAGVPKPDSLKIALNWLDTLKAAADHNPPFVKGRSKIFLRYSTGATSSIGKKIIIGQVNGTDVILQCIAGWGNTLSENNSIVANPNPKKSNGNNFTLAFILSCGEFRYFIGGDMGGQTSGAYINQEQTITKFLNDEYPASFSWLGDIAFKGHVCGFKANHHGSDHSNTSGFMEGMHPAITITSAGDNRGWHLPHPNALTRLSLVKPLTDTVSAAGDIFSRGVYFTNLYNFGSIKSKTKANSLFNNKPGISYDFGNHAATAKGSYLIKIKNEGNLGEQSSFEVGRVDTNNQVPYKKLATFFCHVK